MEFYRLIFKTRANEVHFQACIAYKSDELIRGESAIREPFPMFIDEGKKLFPLVRFQDVFNFAFEEKVKIQIEQNNLSGINFFPIDVLDKEELHYFGVQIYGVSGRPLSGDKIGFIKGINIDQGTWDGNDFFIPNSTKGFYCSERAFKILNSLNIDNLEIINIKEVEWYNIADEK